MAYYTDGNGQSACSCDRCGQRIAHIFEYKGKVYGSDCITVMKGHKPDYYVMHERADGVKVIDEEATVKREEEAKVAQEARAKKAQEDANRNTAELQEMYRCHREGICRCCGEKIDAKRLNFAKFKRITIERCKKCAQEGKQPKRLFV